MGFKPYARFRAEKNETDPAPSSTRPRKPSILLIDDDPTLRASLELALSRNFHVVSAAGSAQGLDAIGPDISGVVLDIKMADKDGFATYTDIRAKDSDLPIIFYSAYQNLKDPYEIINRYRPYGYLAKGNNISELITLLNSAVIHRERLNKHREMAAELAKVRAEMEALRKRLGE